MNQLKKKHYMETIDILEMAMKVMDEAFGKQEEFSSLADSEKLQAKQECMESINRRLKKLENNPKVL